MFDKLTPAHLRLAAYIAAVVYGVYLVITGAVAAADIGDAVASTDAQLGLILAALGGLAGRHIDRSGEPPRVDVADIPTVRAAVADVIEDRVTATVQQPAEPRAPLLADLQRRIAAARGQGRHRAED